MKTTLTSCLLLLLLSGIASADILLNSGPVDLTKGPQVAESFAGKRLHLVQFTGSIKPEWYSELARTGVQIVSYIPDNAYLVYADAPALTKVHQLGEFVRGEGAYRDAYKLQPAAAGKGKQDRGPGLYAIQLINDPQANGATLQFIDSVRLEPKKSQYRILQYLNIIVKLPAESLHGLSQRPDVISIQPYVPPKKLDERQDQIVAGNISGGVPTGPGYLAWLASKGFTQSQFDVSGFAVDVSDSGIDDGTTLPNHFALYEAGLMTGPSHVIYNRLEGLPNPGSTVAGCDGHGTLNAHLIAGYDDVAAAPHIDGSGFHFGLGVAPFVRVGSSVIFDPINFTFPDFANLQSEAYNDGARVSNNSWGTVNAGVYDITAQLFDALTRDAQPAGSTFPVPGNQEMLMVFAAGNEGPSTQTVATPGTAKNVLTIGASESVQSFGGADGCGVADTDANNANDLPNFSSRGPTLDGRRKPELVAAGTHLSGGLIQSTTPGATGQADACFTGSALCGAVGSNFFPSGQQFFTASSGTSHSTPAVAGASALLRQYFINQTLAPPSPAMTRAYLVNSARYLTGNGANDSRWSLGQGMGSLDLGAAFDATPRILKDEIPADILTATGQARYYAGTISDTSKPFRVTLAWTDAPGSTTGAAYNNDLDLVVTAGNNTYFGNVFNGANSATGGTADSRNNLESVIIPAGVSGTFAVTVKAANINSDGVPNFGGPLDQDFALVIYNAFETPVPVIAAGGSQILTESCGNSAIDPNETVNVNFGLSNIGSAATTNLVATLLASGGVISPSGPQTYGNVPPGGVPTFNAFQFTASGSCGGTITATFHLQDGASDLGNVQFVFRLGSDAGGTTSVQNSGVISIPDSGMAVPYPSSINVSGVTGTVTGVTITLQGISHPFPDDLDILLVGPQGQRVMLMSDAGGGTDLNNVQLTFDDAAPFQVPDGDAIVSGTYKTADYEPGDIMPAPAPGPPYGSLLSVFNGANPNGNWKLYVVDDATGDQGMIANGWKVNVTTTLPSCAGTLQFSAATFSQPEGPVGATIHVIRSGGTAGTASVTFTTSDGTATGGTDYIPTNQTVTFDSGQTDQTVIIPILDDLIDEDDETVNLQIANLTGCGVLGTPNTAVLTIVDNDPAPTLSVNDVSVTEGNSGTVNAVFTLNLSTASGRTVSVDYATADGTATAGSDYVATSGTLQYPPGTTSRTVSVTVNGDLLNELDETFFLNLTNAVNTVLSRSQAVGTIISDDILTVTSVTPTSGDSGGGTTTTITGTSFEGGAGVRFGTAASSNVTVNGPTQITAVTPIMPPGTLVDVIVTNTNSISATLGKAFLSDFLDVPGTHPFHSFVEKIFRAGITAGCGGGNFCVNNSVLRSQMAIFLLRGEHGGTYTPPPATGTVFADVPANGFGAAFIEQIYAEGITAGCATNPLRYCPSDPVSRAQMAVFLLRAEHGSGYAPPPASGIFADVPLSHPLVNWIEQLYQEGITSGCATNPLRYCPADDVLRGQMAVFLSRTFGL